MNSRIEIATLTNIARENANHGLAIAEVLQNHIKKVWNGMGHDEDDSPSIRRDSDPFPKHLPAADRELTLN